MRWEHRIRPILFLSAFVLIALTPLQASLVGVRPLHSRLNFFGQLVDNHRFREITGFVVLGLIAFEIIYSLRKRTRVPLPGARGRWRSLHMVIGATLLPLIVVHTGGSWGHNLNGLLLSSLAATVLVGVGGKLVEAVYVDRAVRKAATAARNKEVAKPAAPKRSFHARWLRMHVLLVTALVVLVAFHVFSVYYF